jgi:small-conductance mechanosensitive channel
MGQRGDNFSLMLAIFHFLGIILLSGSSSTRSNTHAGVILLAE